MVMFIELDCASWNKFTSCFSKLDFKYGYLSGNSNSFSSPCYVFLSFCHMISPLGLDCYPTLNRWKTVKQQRAVTFLGPHAPQQKGRIQAWLAAINLSEFLPTRKGRTQSADRHEEICSSPSSGHDRKIEPVLHVFESHLYQQLESHSTFVRVVLLDTVKNIVSEQLYYCIIYCIILYIIAVLLLNNWFFLVHCWQYIKC